MERWSIRVVVYKRANRYEAECLEAAAAGVGSTALEAVNSLVAMLNSMAVFAYRSGSALTVAANADDEALFKRLESGQVTSEIAAFGRMSLTLETGDDADEARLEKMELVGGPA